MTNPTKAESIVECKHNHTVELSRNIGLHRHRCRDCGNYVIPRTPFDEAYDMADEISFN